MGVFLLFIIDLCENSIRHFCINSSILKQFGSMKIKFVIVTCVLFLFMNANSYSQFIEYNLWSQHSITSTIVIYGSAQCSSCNEIKSELNKWNKVFTFYDIDENEVALMEMLKLLKNHGISTKNLAIPVVRIDHSIYTNVEGTEQLILTLKKHLNL